MLRRENDLHKIQGDWLLEEERFKKTAKESISNLISKTKTKTILYGGEIISTGRDYINQNPSLKTFVYSTAVLSAIPVGIFAAFVGITMFFSICTAVMGVLLVQSGAVIVGGAFLLPIEAGILCVAGGATFVGYVTGASNLLITRPSKPKIDRYESLLLKEGDTDENTTIID